MKAGRQTLKPGKAADSGSLHPAPPAKRPGLVSCNTNCMNGDCYRTYDNGKKVHFQAPLKWNSLSGKMEFDSGPCI